MSFPAILQQIKKTLETDPGLSGFASAKWNKKISVKVSYRNREEIAASDLPVIMITRPSVQRSRTAYGTITRKNRVRVYAGFYQPDSDRRQAELIELEEMILTALESSAALRQLVDGMTPADGANDEGALGDCCFTVQEIEIDEKTD